MRRIITAVTCFAFTLASVPGRTIANEYRAVAAAESRSLPNRQGSFGIITSAIADVLFDGGQYVRLQIDSQFPGSSLHGGPIRTGDSIFAVNGRLFNAKDDFVAYVRSLSPGSVSKIDYLVRGTSEKRSTQVNVTRTDLVNMASPEPVQAVPTLETYLARAERGDGIAAMRAAILIGKHDESTVMANLGRIVPLWELAASQEIPDAMTAIGFLYYKGIGGYPRDRQRAASLLRAAAERGSTIAANHLVQTEHPTVTAKEDNTTQNMLIGLAILGGIAIIGSLSSSGERGSDTTETRFNGMGVSERLLLDNADRRANGQ